MDLRRLREETRPEHETTESLMPLTGTGLTLELYIELLQILFPLLRGWEQWAAEAAPAHLKPLLLQRSRSYLIERDLRALGARDGSEGTRAAQLHWAEVVTGAADEAALEEPGFDASFLGALYVVEGSTLGGRLIARHVEAALHLEPGCGNAYFQGHGEATATLWREVTAELAAVPDRDAELVIAAARRTFAAFGNVLRESLAPAALQG